MCVSPRPFPWRTITGRRWPGALKAQGSEVSGLEGVVCIKFKNNLLCTTDWLTNLREFVLWCFPIGQSAKKAKHAGLTSTKEAPLTIFLTAAALTAA
jgi:hypothetical protein